MTEKYYNRTYEFAARTKADGGEVRAELDALVSALKAVDDDFASSLTFPDGESVAITENAAARASVLFAFDEMAIPI